MPLGFIGGGIRGAVNPTPGLSTMQSIIHGALSSVPAYRLGGTLAHLLGGTLGQWGNPASNPSNNFGNPTPGGTTAVSSGPPPAGPTDPGTGGFPDRGYPTGPPAGLPTFGGLNPGQAASDAQTASQTAFQTLQLSDSPFYRPDEIFRGAGPPISRVSPYSGMANIHARDAYIQMLANNGGYSTLPQQAATNAAITSGALPSWQQFTGQPAYQPPAAPAPTAPLLQAFIPPNGRG